MARPRRLPRRGMINLLTSWIQSGFATPREELLSLNLELDDSLLDLILVYPSATSSAIMMLKPTAKASVPRLECLPWDISGISSSTTT